MLNLRRDLQRAQRRKLFLTLRSLTGWLGRCSTCSGVTHAGSGSVEDDMMEILRHQEAQILAHRELWSWHQRRWRKHPLSA